MKRGLFAILAASIVLLLIGCSNDRKAANVQGDGEVELLISAAASLTDALSDLKADFEAEHEGITLTYNFGSSGKLAAQIEQGAPADVFLSASKSDMDRLEAEGYMTDSTRMDFASNSLVLIAPQTSNLRIASFEQINPSAIDQMAIGEPETVPAGRYTKEVLQSLHLWELLQGQLVLASDVRQVLTHVEMGNVELGIVYSSDAAISDDVRVVAEANPSWHEPIVYPGGVVRGSVNEGEARTFLKYLASERGKETLRRYGFQ